MIANHFFARKLALGCAAGAAIAFGADSLAQIYPAKPVRLLVAFTPGSGADTIGRIAAAGLADVFGQQVIVDNRGGAAGNIGTEIAARAPADGYLLFLVNVSHAVNISLYRNLPFDLLRDFAAITKLASSPQVVVVHPSLPVKSTADLVRLAKAKPGAINYSSAGAGTSTYLATELFKVRAGINLVQVPYRGGGEAMTAVIAGETSVYFAPAAPALPYVREGRLRALAVTSAQRLPLLPDLPTVAEAGYPGYERGNWYGLMVPARTPKDIVATIHRAAVTALNRPDINKRLTDLGYITAGDSPDEFTAYIKSEIEQLAKLLRELGVKPG
jgi:tripartite-type tricarboxylate transporter receptor subunit TctC